MAGFFLGGWVSEVGMGVRADDGGVAYWTSAYCIVMTTLGTRHVTVEGDQAIESEYAFLSISIDSDFVVLPIRSV